MGRLNIIILGDFTGRSSRGVNEPLDARKLIAADVDNFERVFAQLGPRLTLSGMALPEARVELAFSSLDDFHPDNLVAEVPSLTKLADARRLVLNPATAEQGKAALQAYLGAAVAPPAAQPAAESPPTPESDDDALSRLLGDTPPRARTPVASSQFDEFIRQVVAPHVTSAPGAWQSGAVAAAEIELGNRLNAILHDPDFQALEASWRGLDMVVRRIESSEETGLLVLDVTLAEIQADLAASQLTTQSALFRLLRARTPALLVGNFTFGRTAEDVRALGKLAEIAATLSAPFVAAAAPGLVGCDSFALHPDPDDWTFALSEDVAAVWERLRQSTHASHAGLTAPRFLLRQPYGEPGDAIASFPFEEMRGDASHESFLWGHSAILCACAIIDARQAGDLELEDFTGGEIGDMPVHVFTDDGEKVVKPYAEAWLTERSAESMLARGILPVVAARNRNTIRLNRLCSIANGRVALRIPN